MPHVLPGIFQATHLLTQNVIPFWSSLICNSEIWSILIYGTFLSTNMAFFFLLYCLKILVSLRAPSRSEGPIG